MKENLFGRLRDSLRACILGVEHTERRERERGKPRKLRETTIDIAQKNSDLYHDTATSAHKNGNIKSLGLTSFPQRSIILYDANYLNNPHKLRDRERVV